MTVLEKHADFLRDFRGDTVHPSTLDLIDDLGLTEELAQLPQRDVASLRATFSDGTFTVADFSQLRTRHPYIKFLPQWDLLDLLADAASRFDGFTLLRRTEVVDLVRDAGTVTGVRAVGPDGEIEVRARVTVAADGRGSVVRQRLGLTPTDYGAPMDVLWFRLPRVDGESEGLDMRIGPGGLMLCIDRGDYWQIAFVIDKGGYDTVVARGLIAFRQRVAGFAPMLADRVDAIASWDDVKMLTVQVNRLRQWHQPGVLLIGDAAHAMSPIGGVGIKHAVQYAVAAARVLLPALRAGSVPDSVLARVRRRRRFPTAATQLLQRVIQRRLVQPVLSATEPIPAPRALHLVRRIPFLQTIPARVIGIGIRPETLKAR